MSAGLHFAAVVLGGNWCAESEVTDRGSGIPNVAKVVGAIGLL